ncbi:MAG: hypothetical protein ACRC1R_00280 [Cetobacterium sp.]|uniref:hypothetical protein n=1 Tax=Cetobacterium sp. TaxID=2071632 RepID=UPI003F323494
MNYEEKLKNSLLLYWNEERISKFLILLENTFPIYKGEILSYFIDKILEKEPFIDEYKILSYVNRMDGFFNSYEFLEDLFSSSKDPNLVNLLLNIEDDEDKINNIIETLIEHNNIEIFEHPNEFLVWIK